MPWRKQQLNRIGAVLRDTPWGWFVLAFAAYFHLAQFVPRIGWNAVELIIAQHVLDHGTYATSLDYPSALPWRPPLPVLVIAAIRLVTADPLRIYQWFCGLALASFVAAMFWCARLLWGRAAAHAAGLLALLCPAVTTALINHTHSYSHLGALLVLGPAFYLSLSVVKQRAAGHAPSAARSGLAGLAWAVACLSRSELVLFAACFFAALGWIHLRQRSGWRRTATALAGFLVIWLPYQMLVGHVAARDGSLIRKPIYGMYTSQGWVDPPPGVGPDVERDGYVYAVQLYGDPLDHDESMLRAIVGNPGAFARRLKLNAINFYRAVLDEEQFGRWWGAAALIGAAVAFMRRHPLPNRVCVTLLAGTFAASHFLLIFHVDPRYLTIAAPALILFPASLLERVAAARARRRVLAYALLVVGIAAFATWTGAPQWRALIHDHNRERPERGIRAMRSLAEAFHAQVPKPVLRANREPHIAFHFPEPSPLAWEDMFLLGYFSRTAWYMHAPETPFPRGRLYSFRECADDYAFTPANHDLATANPRATRVLTYDNPVLGAYTLWQLHAP